MVVMRTLLTIGLAGLLLFSMLFNPARAAEPRTELVIEKPSLGAIVENSPDSISREKGRWSEFYKNNLSGVRNTSINIATTASAFYLASLVHVLYRMSTEPEKDAEMLRNFFTNQVFSGQAQMSFMMMILGVQSANSAFSSLGTRFHWIKDERHIHKIMNDLAKVKGLSGNSEMLTNSKGVHPNLLAEWKKVRAQAERLVPGRVNSVQFGKLALLGSFSVVMPLVTVFSDLLADPDIIFYADSLISSQETISQMSRERGYGPYAAHQRAYDRWVKSNKIMDYTPALLSSWTTISIQLFAFPALYKMGNAGIQRLLVSTSPNVSRVLVKGINFAKTGARLLPQSRILGMLGAGVVFLSMNEPIHKAYDKIYNEQVYSKQIANQMHRLQGLTVRPVVPKECFDSIAKSKTFDKKRWDSLSYSAIKTVIDMDERSECSDMPASHEQSIDSLSADFSRWRHTWFKDSMNTLQSWAAHTEKVKADYAAAYSIYKKFVSDLKQDPESMLEAYPFFGIGQITGQNFANDQQQKLAEIYILIDQNIKKLKAKSDLSADERKILDLYSRMFSYLSAFNSKLGIPNELAAQYQIIERKKITTEEKNTQKGLARNAFASLGISVFKQLDETELSSLVKSKAGEIDRLADLLKMAKPQLPGELWVEKIRLNEFLNVKREATEKTQSLKGVSAKDSIEWLVLNLICSPNDATKNVIEKTPFWSFEFQMPSLMKDVSQNPCSKTEIMIPRIGSEKKNLFNAGLQVGNETFTNLISYAVKNVRPEFTGTNGVENFDQWWKSNIDVAVAKDLASEEKQFRKEFNANVWPALHSKASFSGMMKGYLPSIRQEVEFYLSLMSKLGPKYSARNADTLYGFTIAETLVNDPYAIDKWMSLIKNSKDPEISVLAEQINRQSRINILASSKLMLTRLNAILLKKMTDYLEAEKELNSDSVSIAQKLIVTISFRINEMISLLNIYHIFLIQGM
jgi:hypothetical protein